MSLVAQTVKNLPAVQADQGLIPEFEDPLEKGMATHSNILAWRTPWTEEPGELQSMGSQTVRPAWATNTFTFMGTLLIGLPAFTDKETGSLVQSSKWQSLTVWFTQPSFCYTALQLSLYYSVVFRSPLTLAAVLQSRKLLKSSQQAHVTEEADLNWLQPWLLIVFFAKILNWVFDDSPRLCWGCWLIQCM